MASPLVASTVPDAITSLLQHFANVATASGYSSFEVTDGEPVEYVANYLLQLTGWSNHHRVWASASGDFSVYEDYDLDCLIRCWQGDSDPVSRRLEAFHILDMVIVELLNDKNAGGALTMSGDWEIVSSESVQGPAQGAGGWGVDLNFVVHCENIYLTVT